MRVGCSDHVHANRPQSVAKLKRSLCPLFHLLMVFSLLLADGLLPAWAIKLQKQKDKKKVDSLSSPYVRPPGFGYYYGGSLGVDTISSGSSTSNSRSGGGGGGGVGAGGNNIDANSDSMGFGRINGKSKTVSNSLAGAKSSGKYSGSENKIRSNKSNKNAITNSHRQYVYGRTQKSYLHSGSSNSVSVSNRVVRENDSSGRDRGNTGLDRHNVRARYAPAGRRPLRIKMTGKLKGREDGEMERGGVRGLGAGGEGMESYQSPGLYSQSNNNTESQSLSSLPSPSSTSSRSSSSQKSSSLSSFSSSLQSLSSLSSKSYPSSSSKYLHSSSSSLSRYSPLSPSLLSSASSSLASSPYSAPSLYSPANYDSINHHHHRQHQKQQPQLLRRSQKPQKQSQKNDHNSCPAVSSSSNASSCFFSTPSPPPPPSSPSSSLFSNVSMATSRDLLPLTSARVQNICCRCQTNKRMQAVRKTRLRFCSSYNTALSTSCASSPSTSSQGDCPLLGHPDSCRKDLENIIELDAQAEQIYSSFLELIQRFDCNDSYSVKWDCQHCKQAYKDWLCSEIVPYYDSGVKVTPCSTFCTHVEMMCPFFQPKIDTHAGDPSFICKDPDMSALGSKPTECYSLCHVRSKSNIEDFYCPRNRLHGAPCPLLTDCPKLQPSTTKPPTTTLTTTTTTTTTATTTTTTSTATSTTIGSNNDRVKSGSSSDSDSNGNNGGGSNKDSNNSSKGKSNGTRNSSSSSSSNSRGSSSSSSSSSSSAGLYSLFRRRTDHAYHNSYSWFSIMENSNVLTALTVMVTVTLNFNDIFHNILRVAGL